MAFAMRFVDDRRLFANVNESVGGKSSRSDDIMLVQALLKTVFSKEPIKVTGHFDATTAKLIKYYQSKRQKRGKPDGIVSPVYETSFYKAWSYTIIDLQITANNILVATGLSEPLVEFLKLSYPHLVGPLDNVMDFSISPMEERPYSNPTQPSEGF